MVSVIVPVYNAEAFLNKCIDALIGQRFKDLEIILVDDGSTDQSAGICDEYAKQDGRIRVIHSVNQGAGSARNTGMALATGQWICFMDADDWCDESYVSAFFEKGAAEDDLVIQSMQREVSDKAETLVSLLDKRYSASTLSACILDNDLLNYGGPCCKLFSRKIIIDHHLQFPVAYNYGEDTVFFFRYLTFCNHISCTSEAHYHYLDHSPETLSQKIHDSLALMTFVANSFSAIKKWSFVDRRLLVLYNKKSVFYSRRAYSNMFKLRYHKTEAINAIVFFRQNVRCLISAKGLSFDELAFYAFTGLAPVVQYYCLCLFRSVGVIKV